MGSHRTHHTDEGRGRHGHGNGVQTVVRLVTMGLVVAAVVKELRTPEGEREWNGTLAGFVPYDFRLPTFDRFKERVWDPHSERLINPRVFGVGWTVNVGRVLELVREKAAAAG